LKSLEVVKTGIGMPAFVGDKSYIGFLTGEGVSLENARNYTLAGCLDANIPGKSRIGAIQMFVVPLVFELAIYNGVDSKTGEQLGLRTGEFEDFKSFDDFMNAFKKQLAHFLSIAAEQQNIILQAQTELTPDPYCSSMMEDAIKIGKDVLERTMTFENGSTLNAIGMINVVDSMAVIKKLVFDDKKITMRDLKQALIANWQGPEYQEIRKMCLDVPKYGNGFIYVDSLAKELYQFWVDTIKTFTTAWGGTMKPSGVSITSYGPGGALTGATPDGRYDGENLADGTMSAAQGKDTHGPTALLRSAMTVDQIPFGSTLLNVKFHNSALETTEDLKKLASLIKTYFNKGGKHIQFNVVNKDTLLAAQKTPENYADLIVRVAGYSAYFVQLSKDIQEDIISRTEHELV
jgi:pyruvate-formate lyase